MLMVTFGTTETAEGPRPDHRLHLQMHSFAERDEHGQLVMTNEARQLANLALHELVEKDHPKPRVPAERIAKLFARVRPHITKL